jgi:hypothetical protein
LKKIKNSRKNRHHIIPLARLRRSEIKLIGITELVDIQAHDWLHRNFGTLTPMEIFDWLNQTFWGGRYKIHIEGEDE